MSGPCDLCGTTILAGEPRRGGAGDGGESGARFGFSRHWSCHVERFGHRESPLLATKRPAEALGLSPARPRKRPLQPVLAPKVLRGPYNLSPNATREWKPTGGLISEMGRRRIEVECPFCFATFWAFLWSLAGSGKRCSNCGALHYSSGVASPIEGNEDLASD